MASRPGDYDVFLFESPDKFDHRQKTPRGRPRTHGDIQYLRGRVGAGPAGKASMSTVKVELSQSSSPASISVSANSMLPYPRG